MSQTRSRQLYSLHYKSPLILYIQLSFGPAALANNKMRTVWVRETLWGFSYCFEHENSKNRAMCNSWLFFLTNNDSFATTFSSKTNICKYNMLNLDLAGNTATDSTLMVAYSKFYGKKEKQLPETSTQFFSALPTLSRLRERSIWRFKKKDHLSTGFLLFGSEVIQLQISTQG